MKREIKKRPLNRIYRGRPPDIERLNRPSCLQISERPFR